MAASMPNNQGVDGAENPRQSFNASFNNKNHRTLKSIDFQNVPSSSFQINTPTASPLRPDNRQNIYVEDMSESPILNKDFNHIKQDIFN